MVGERLTAEKPHVMRLTMINDHPKEMPGRAFLPSIKSQDHRKQTKTGQDARA
jgi:hypothetical protein